MRSRAQTIAIILSRYKKKIGSRGARFEAQASPAIKAMTFYHGTPDEKTGLAILESGLIKVPDKKQGRGMMAPVAGKVYIAPSKENAAVYGLGGLMMGENPHIRKGESNYGYVFQVDSSKLNDVQPDEDGVGDMLSAALNGKTHIKAEHGSFLHTGGDGKPMPRSILRLLPMISAKDAHKMKWGEVAYATKVAKRLMKYLSDAEKLELIQLGAHAAHEGDLPIVRAWRVDKRRGKEIKRDGSNLMEIAEEVPIKRP